MKLVEMFASSSRQKLMEGIDHPEDLIIQQGSKGADRVIQDLAKLETDPSTITIKWDGLPALVWGRDKEGNFHLVDKHMFDKIAKGKMEFMTIQAYDEERGSNRSSLWEKDRILRPVLEAATPNVRDQYWFGDFMYAGTPPTKDGKFVFKPNTVEYRVSEEGELGRKISESQAGMAVHTFIPGLGSDDQPLVGLKGLDENSGVVFFVGEIKDKPKVKVDNTVLAKAQATVNEHRAAVDKFLADLTEMKAKSVITAMSPFITRMLEEDDISGNIVPRFLEFLPERLTPAAAEKMLGKNKDGWLYQADGGGPGLLGIWSMWAAVTELKTSVKQLLDSQMQGSEVQALTDGVDAHEGYVFGAGKDKLKLIDRLGFTKANFARYRISDEEKKSKASMPMAAFCFGRMNPPTLGHGLVMNKTVEVGGKDAYIFLSNSQGKDDPLDPSTKSQFIKKMYPKLASHIVDDYVQGPIYAANWLYDRGFRNITFVGGSDRLGKAPGSIEKLLNGWNSGPVRTTDAARGDSGREYINLNFVSSGERDPDAPGVTGYSGTKARQAAADGNEDKFWEYTGASPNLKVGAVNLYQATRAGMGIKDEPAEEGMESMLDEGWKDKLAAAGVAGVMGLSSAAGAADRSPDSQKLPIVATVVIDGEIKNLDLSSKGFNDVREAEKWLKKFMKDRDIMDWQAKIERSKPGTGQYQKLTVSGAGGLESVSNQDFRMVDGHSENIDEMFDPFGPVTNLEYALYLLTVLSIPVTVLGTLAFKKVKNQIAKMGSRSIINMLSKKQIKVNSTTRSMLEKLLDELRESLYQDDGEKAKKIALQIKQIVNDSEDNSTRATEDIRKVKDGYRLVSKKSGRNLGTYPTRAGAEKRERQVQYFKHADESIQEAPIEMDPTDPMDPMIHGHDKANPGKLKYRMARAAGQLKDLAARVDGASPEDWKRMAQQFEELKMNMEQIRHALEELSKIRKKGGIRSRGITI